jgi:3-hydroxyisobutyrate dehydrogenase-like beta-hydroxyacid dehydrogenase
MTHGEMPAERHVRTGAAQTAETVAVLGAGGMMGLPMERNIARAGIAVRAWNRSRDKVEPLAADLPYLRVKARAITERDFTPSFRLKLAAKDAGLVRDAAWQRGLDLPLFELIADRLGEGTGEHGEKDVSATYLTGAPEHAA